MRIILVLFVLQLLVLSCEDTNEDRVGSRGLGVVPAIIDLNPESPTFVDLEEDSVTFSAFLAKGETVDRAAIQISYLDKKVTLKEITLTDDTSDFKIVGSEILTALNLTKDKIELGEKYVVNIVTTFNGSSTISPAAFVIKLPCEYDASLNNGSYAEVSTDWNIDSNVAINADESDPNVTYVKGLAEADGLVGNGNTMKLTIDPATFKITGEKTVLAANCGGWGAAYAKYTNYAYTVVSGMYSSCDGNYTVVFNISTDQEDFGDYKFIFTK